MNHNNPASDELPQTLAFDTTNITSPGNVSNPKPDDPCHTLAAGAHAPAVVLSFDSTFGANSRVIEDQSPPLKVGSGLDIPSPPAVAYGIRADATRVGEAKTPSPDAEGRIRLRNPGLGISPDLAPTLDTGGQHGVATPELAVRRLTPLECERLMGWDDFWTATGIDPDGKEITIADSSRYRMCGNGVASPVATWIGECIIAAHNEAQP
jgi:DNA (cytosine-5)-methyltransferase 1